MTNNIEIWKDVVGYEEYFQISNHGRLFSKRTEKILRQTVSKTGYYQTSTKIGGRNGTNKCFRIHRVVADAFIVKTHPDFVVNHIDGNKLNNHVSNLEWVSLSDNTKHAYQTGLKVAHRKLTDEQVQEIRLRHSNGEKCKTLAMEFGMSPSHISNITSYRKYTQRFK